MRLHRLEVTAFGPFADTVTVDFDELSGAGLFLLTGPTGSGKSSVLDAVCFALYGAVPGDRGHAKRLRCDRAPEDRAPRVVLEATLSGRRFLLDRSPAWSRPKKRGSGTTTAQASVAISEWVDDGWVTRSTRLDETGHLVTALVGMNLPQFCQVAMLPQGRFQAFLRARSEERHALLAQVFRTGRFETVEQWLRERRTTTRRASEAQREVVADVVSRLSETAGTELPDSCADLTDAAGDGSLSTWSAELVESVREQATGAATDAERCQQAEKQARADLDEARDLQQRQRRYADAAARRARLVDAEPSHTRRLERLARAGRAAAVAPLLQLAAEAEAASQEATAARETALDRLPDPAAGREALADRSRSLADRAASARAALPREEQLGVLRRRGDALTTSLERRRRRHEELLGRRSELPHLLEEAREHLTAADRASAALPGARSRVEQLSDRLGGHELLGRLVPEHAEATELRDHTREARNLAHEQWLAVREARLDGMAAELAHELAVGDSCPVCGSGEHPHPARAAEDAPDAAAERAARISVDDAEGELLVREERLRDLDSQLARAQERAGDEPHGVTASALAEARSALADLLAAAGHRDQHAERLHHLQQQLTDVDAELATTVEELRADEIEHHTTVQQVEDLARELGAVLDGTGQQCCTDLIAGLTEEQQRVDDALAALGREQQARHEHERARGVADGAATDAGFETAAAAQDAILPGDEAVELQRLTDEHRDDAVRTDALLADPDLVAASALPGPDAAALATALTRASERATSADRRHTLAARRLERLSRLDVDLGEALQAWAPLRSAHALAASMAGFVDGTAPDNRLQMRLSAYVLAHRLGQVVAAANERLAGMSDTRYRLEHTGRRGAGETRGGLSLLVRDDWSGEARDPATLSGGETFVVSLALALGLADVITREAGGADLDTLFVDEGFGSLDAETLDQVMDHLDGLRDGGRVVGVVSHVAEMADRIPTQLRVRKDRDGSAVAVTAGATG